MQDKNLYEHTLENQCVRITYECKIQTCMNTPLKINVSHHLGQKKKIIWLSSTARSSFSGRSHFFFFLIYIFFFYSFFFFLIQFFFFFFFFFNLIFFGGAMLNAKHTILCIGKDQNASRCQFCLFSTQLGIY